MLKMGCDEFSGISKYRLNRNDFAIRFTAFEVGAAVTCSVMDQSDVARKYATRHVEGTVAMRVSAEAGDMFDGTIRWIEDITEVETPYPRLVIDLADGDAITCLVERSPNTRLYRALGWAMIISPAELLEAPWPTRLGIPRHTHASTYA